MTRTEDRRLRRRSTNWRGSSQKRWKKQPTLVLRDWPGLNGWKPATPSPTYARGNTIDLVLHAAAEKGVTPEAGVTPERFGLLVYQVTQGPSLLDAGVVVSDDLPTKGRAGIRKWAKANPVETVGGSQPRKVLTLTEFFEPRRGVFTRIVYTGGGRCIGADLGRIFGLCAEHIVPGRGKNADSWTVYLPGWGRIGEKGLGPSTLHRPPLRLTARTEGWMISFAPSRSGNGKYVGSRQWQGNFDDVLSAAYVFSSDRHLSFSERLISFGLDPVEMPLAVTPDAKGAATMVEAAAAGHELALVLDNHASRWLTTSQDRQEDRTRLDLSRLASTGGLATQILLRIGVRAPIETFDMSPDEHRKWAASFHGGLIHADPRLLGVPFSAVAADVSSCHALVAHLIDWWPLLCAERIERVNMTTELRALCERVATDPRLALDPAVWRRFRCCLVQVVPNGEVFLVEVEDDQHPEGHLEYVPVYSPDCPLHYSALDVIASAVSSGRAPKIVEATAYAPSDDRQSGLRRRLPLLPGLILDTEEDPAVAIVEHRQKIKGSDPVLAATLRVLVLALGFGNACRFDDVLSVKGRGERAGPMNCLPVASSITAGSHLILATLQRMVQDLGGVVAYKQTDSSIIPASPLGGDLSLPDGSVVRSLSWTEIDTIVAAFDPLAPTPEWRVWQVERGTKDAPLESTIFGVNRHVERVDGQIIDLTETGLGGNYVAPPGMSGRRGAWAEWSFAAVEREVAYAAAKRADPEDLYIFRGPAPWDSDEDKVPAFRRFMVRTPAMAKPRAFHVLGARPGTRYVLASGDGRYVGTAIALDPGGDLSNWRLLDWIDTESGDHIRVTTDLGDYRSFPVQTLADAAEGWSRIAHTEPITEVSVNSHLVSHDGRVASVLAASSAGVDQGDLRSYRPTYEGADLAGFVTAEANRLGAPAFARLYDIPPRTARGICGGSPPADKTIAAVMASMGDEPAAPTCQADDCDKSVLRGKWCSEACRMRAYRTKKAAEKNTPRPTSRRPSEAVKGTLITVQCACGVYLDGAAARRGVCSSCSAAVAI